MPTEIQACPVEYLSILDRLGKPVPRRHYPPGELIRRWDGVGDPVVCLAEALWADSIRQKPHRVAFRGTVPTVMSAASHVFRVPMSVRGPIDITRLHALFEPAVQATRPGSTFRVMVVRRTIDPGAEREPVLIASRRYGHEPYIQAFHLGPTIAPQLIRLDWSEQLDIGFEGVAPVVDALEGDISLAFTQPPWSGRVIGPDLPEDLP